MNKKNRENAIISKANVLICKNANQRQIFNY